MPRVLVLTGRLCLKEIQQSLRDMDVEVMALPIEVASLMTVGMVRSFLQGVDLGGYDFVLLPGMFRDDVQRLAADFETPFFLGPVHHVDIPDVLRNLAHDQLSTRLPADRAMAELLRDKVLSAYRKASSEASEDPPRTVSIGTGKRGVVVGEGFPPRILAEIVAAPRKDAAAILREAKRFARAGADIIDLGMIPGEDNSPFIHSTLPLLKQDPGLPVSVDTMQESEILAAADAGADLILSICGRTLDLVDSIAAPVVVVPMHDPDRGRPRSAVQKIELLRSFDRALEGRAAVMDPLLEPLGMGFSDSLRAYGELKRLIHRPCLMGIGNVTEMVDADSPGVNAVLVGLALESGASLLLTTENSRKTFGSVREAAIATRMMYYAVRHGLPPKDLGIHLLRYKEKSRRTYPARLPRTRILAAASAGQPIPSSDERPFHILLRGANIHVVCTQDGEEIDVIGRTAASIADELQSRGLLPEARHALYLGGELAKAEIALRTNRSYVQDEAVFDGELGDDYEGSES